jgi:hypothetical protein
MKVLLRVDREIGGLDVAVAIRDFTTGFDYIEIHTFAIVGPAFEDIEEEPQVDVDAAAGG